MKPLCFSNLISPCTVDDFFQHHWEKQFLHVARNEPNYFEAILNTLDIDDFLSQQNLQPDAIKLVRQGVEIPQTAWTKNAVSSHDATVAIAADVEKILQHYHQGATIIINGAQKTIPSLLRACVVLEQELKIPMQNNIYITPPKAQGFSMHYDTHDIFSVQIKGSKTWRFYDTGENIPTQKQPFSQEPKLIKELTMQAGDLLYMPRGAVHEAFSSEEATIHVNFSIKPRYGFHLIEELAQLAEKEAVFFRRTTPHGFNTEEDRHTYIADFKAHFHLLLDKYGAELLLKNQENLFVKNQIMNHKGRFQDALASEQLTLETIVVRRTGFSVLTSKEGNATLVKYGNQEIKIPEFIENAIFFQDKPFKIRDIRGLVTHKGKLDLVRELLRAGFLEIPTQC